MNQFKTLAALLLLILAFTMISFISHRENFGRQKTLYIMTNQGDTLQPQHYADVADNYLRSLNEKDLEGILSLYAENATVEDPVGSNVIKGKEALHKFYSGAVMIDLQLQRTGPVRIAGNEIAFPFKLMMKVDGVTMITDIIDVFKFDDEGKVISMRAFWGPANRRVAKNDSSKSR